MELNGLLTAFLLLLLAILASVSVIMALSVRKTWRQIVSFITPAAENQESPLAVVLDALAQRVGHSIAVEVKTTLLGKESGLKRGEQAVAGDVAMDLLGQEKPLLAGLLEGFPTLKKRLLKNPGLIGAALGLLGGNGKGGGPAPAGGGGGGNSQSAFRI